MNKVCVYQANMFYFLKSILTNSTDAQLRSHIMRKSKSTNENNKNTR